MASPALQSSLTPQPLVAARPPPSFSVDGVPCDLGEASSWIVVRPEAGDGPAAAYRTLAHRIARQPAVQVVVVTSPAPGDGKTICAVNLALALTEDGSRRLLLVEANRRAPRIARLLDVRIPACFDDQLRALEAGSRQAWSAVAVGSPRLHLLAVDPDRELCEWLAPRAYRRLIEQARTSYDLVLLDCSSLACPGDLPVIVDAADAALLVARARRTRARDIDRIARQIAPTRVLGVVLVGGES